MVTLNAQSFNADGIKHWDITLKGVNEHTNAGLRYKKNRYTGAIPFD
jgi:hypothetical protein